MNFLLKLVLLVSFVVCSIFKAESKINDYEAAIQAYYQHDIDTAFIHLKNALQENERNLPAKLLLAEVLIKKQQYSSAEQELSDATFQGADINLIISPLSRSLLFQGKFDSVLLLGNGKKLNRQSELNYKLIKAKAYRGLSDIDAAENLYQEILLAYPDNTEATLELASIYNTMDNLEKSQELLKKVSTLSSENSRLWQLKGQLSRAQGQLGNALTNYIKANKLEPDNIAISRAIASIYLELKKPKKAQAIVDNILLSHPNDLQTQLMKSNIFRSFDKKQLSNAVLMKLTNQLSSIDESYMLSQPQLLLIDAMSSYGQENWLQAKNKFQIYIKQGIDNNDMSPVILLADVYMKLNESDSALELLSNYEHYVIKNKDYALILAGLYLESNDNFKADYILSRLSKKHADDEKVLILSAKALSQRGEHKEAISLLEAASFEDSINYRYTLAIIALRAGDLKKGLAYAKLLVSNSPDAVEYQLLYIEVLLQQNQYDEAERVIEDLYQKQPTNRQVRFTYAMLQFNLENIIAAKEIFTDLVTENPEDSKSWFVLAQMAYDLGNIDEATAILERQTKNGKHKFEALYKLASIHYSQEAYDKSLLIINVILQSNRLATKALTLKAKNLIALQQSKEAKRQLDILFSLWRNSAHNLLELSRLQLNNNDYIAAEKSLETAYALKPDALPVVIDLIKLKLRLNKLIEASSILAKAESMGYSNNNYLIILKGDIELANGNANAAFNYYWSVLKNDDTNIIALIKLSSVSQTKILSDRLIQQLSYLVDKYPNKAILRHLFADHLFEHNKLKQAKYQYQQLIIQDIPRLKRAWALNNLAIIHQQEGDFQEAVEVSQQALSMLSVPTIIDTVGWSLTLSGDVNEGLSYLRQAFSLDATSPEIQYHIAFALVKLNRQDEAKILLANLIKLPDTFAEYQLVKQLLHSL